MKKETLYANNEKVSPLVTQSEYCLYDKDAELFEYKDYYYISEIKDELNRISSVDNIKKVTGVAIWEFLSSAGYVEERMTDGKMTKIYTELGKEKGIIRIDKISTKGYAYSLLMYPEEVQREIVEHFIKVQADEDN